MKNKKAAVLAHVLSVFKSEAESGNSVAAYELGRCYKMGTFGDIDFYCHGRAAAVPSVLYTKRI